MTRDRVSSNVALMAAAKRAGARRKASDVEPLEEFPSAVMLLGRLYAEEKGGRAPSPWPDDGAHKSWNYYWGVLKKRRLITAPTNRQIYEGNAPRARITDKGIAEYERIKALSSFERMLADWEENCEIWRKAAERADVARDAPPKRRD